MPSSLWVLKATYSSFGCIIPIHLSSYSSIFFLAGGGVSLEIAILVTDLDRNPTVF